MSADDSDDEETPRRRRRRRRRRRCCFEDVDGETSTTTSAISTAPISRNVRLVLIYTWFVFAGRSIWNQNVLATFVYLLRNNNPEAVGTITAVMGLMQLFCSIPAGILADKYRRDSLLKVAAVVGVAAVGITLVALYYSSYERLILALAAWGAFWGVANTSLSALFADSIPDGQRSHYFTQRSVLINLGNVMGPFLALLMFLRLGDQWTIRDCTVVMVVGQLMCCPAVLLLCFLNDDYAVLENNASAQDEALPSETGEQSSSSSLADPLLSSEAQPQTEESSSYNEVSLSVAATSTEEVSEHQVQTNDETFDLERLSTICSFLPEQRVVPCLVAMADMTAGLASGMSIRYFAIFLYDNLGLAPVIVQVLYIFAPLVQASLMKLAQWLAKRFGSRCTVAVLFKWTGISLMIAMVVLYLRKWPAAAICVVLVFRTAFMNSTSALTKSVLMDAVPKQERAKWSALESLNMFSWSGSAALGGVLVGWRGIIFNFCVTAGLQLVATIPLLVLASCDGSSLSLSSSRRRRRRRRSEEERS